MGSLTIVFGFSRSPLLGIFEKRKERNIKNYFRRMENVEMLNVYSYIIINTSINTFKIVFISHHSFLFYFIFLFYLFTIELCRNQRTRGKKKSKPWLRRKKMLIKVKKEKKKS